MAAKKKVAEKELPSGVPEYVKRVPIGMAWIYNRLPYNFSMTFNANEELWEPYEYRLVPIDLAKHCERRGIHRWDPLGTKTVMALVDQRHKFFGVPLPKSTKEKPTEVLVRNKGLDATGDKVTEVEVPE